MFAHIQAPIGTNPVTADTFYIPKNSVYLLNHSVGCLPTRSRSAGEKFLSLWAEHGSLAWPAWLEELSQFKENIGKLINGKAIEVSQQSNVSSGLTKILFSLPQRAGRKKLLVSKLDFPSIGFALSRGKTMGYEIEFIEPIEMTTPIESWLSRINSSVQLLVISHSTFGNSLLNPVEEICQAARKQGVYTLVDVAQSAGVLPIDVQKWGCDFVSGSCVKWLCGGPGAGFIWVRSDRISELTPIDVGWFSHRDPTEFDITQFEYAETSDRFQGGTPSILPYFVANQSVQTILEIGVEKIRAHNSALTQQLLEGALELGLSAISPTHPLKRGGTLCLNWNGKSQQEIEASLKEARVRVDFRKGYGFRFSPHIYNSADEIKQVVDLLKLLV